MRKRLALYLAVVAIVGVAFILPSVRELVSGIIPLARPALPLPPQGEPLPFSLTEGFAAHLFANNVPGARVLARDPEGVLIASLTSDGKVVAMPDRDGNGSADEVLVLLDNLNRPHGLAVRCTERCQLYVAETDALSVYDYEYDESRQINRPVNGTKIVDLPSSGGHSTRSILFMPQPNDHKLLISVGSSCNVCEETDWRRAKVLVADAGGNDLTEYAKGLRNTVFMTIHPVTGEIWGTDMGRDHLGDDLPPDEINIIRQGGNYGWPICYGKNTHDTSYDKNTYIRNPCMEPFETPSHIDIPAHSAPLGLAFVPEEGWPEGMWYDALVAYHGSWNRSIPTGYKIVRFPLDAHGNPEGPAQDFLTGFMNGKASVIGRPVDILAEPGGSLYISDDRAGAIYRIVRTKEY